MTNTIIYKIKKKIFLNEYVHYISITLNNVITSMIIGKIEENYNDPWYTKEYLLLYDYYITNMTSLKFTLLNYKKFKEFIMYEYDIKLFDERINIPYQLLPIQTNYFGFKSMKEFLDNEYTN